MNFGIHFSLNKKFSRPERGICIYNYRNIINTEFNSVSSPAHLKYPIYLSISPHEVAFYFHLSHNNQNTDIEHTNSPILILSSSSRTEDHETLTKSIQNIFHDTHNLLIEGLKEKRDIHHESISNQLTYSQLKVFSESQSYRIESPGSYLYPHKKLFLDFLYDAEHTQVFLSSPAFSTIYDKLNENFLFLAIKNKAKYYYYRVAIGNLDFDHLNSQKAHQLLDHYIEAERQWVASITAPKAESNFYFSHGWMDKCRHELDHVFEIISKFDPPNKKAPYNVSDTFEYLNPNEKSKHDKKSERIRDVANHALQWHQHKFQPTGFYQIMTGKKPLNCFRLHMIILGLYAIYTCLICYNDSHFFESQIAPYILAVILIALVNPLYIWISSLIKINVLEGARIIKEYLKNKISKKANVRNNISIIRKSKQIPLTNAYFPRLLAALIAAWIPLSVDASVNTSFYKEKIIVIYPILAILATLLFLYHEIRKRNPYLKFYRIFMRSGSYLLISFFYSTLIGVISMSLFALTYVKNYLMSPSTQILPKGTSTLEWLVEQDEVKRISFDFYGILDSPLDVIIFHHMLIPFSVFAIFIGVCLQSIFGEKTVGEPL